MSRQSGMGKKEARSEGGGALNSSSVNRRNCYKYGAAVVSLQKLILDNRQLLYYAISVLRDIIHLRIIIQLC